jgi:hypothetical protein
MPVKMVVLDYKDRAPFSVQSESRARRKNRRYSFSLRSTGTTAKALFWNEVVNVVRRVLFPPIVGAVSPLSLLKRRSPDLRGVPRKRVCYSLDTGSIDDMDKAPEPDEEPHHHGDMTSSSKAKRLPCAKPQGKPSSDSLPS